MASAFFLFLKRKTISTISTIVASAFLIFNNKKYKKKYNDINIKLSFLSLLSSC